MSTSRKPVIGKRRSKLTKVEEEDGKSKSPEKIPAEAKKGQVRSPIPSKEKKERFIELDEPSAEEAEQEPSAEEGEEQEPFTELEEEEVKSVPLNAKAEADTGLEKKKEVPVDSADSSLYLGVKFTQYCCQYPTQYPSRMKDCESAIHTVTGRLFGLADRFTASKKSYTVDGIVEIKYENYEGLLNEYEISSGIVAKYNHISDHDIIFCDFTTKTHGLKNFNIVSANLEGLCRHKFDEKIACTDPNSECVNYEFERRLELFDLHFKDIIWKGSIVVIQEAILKNYNTEVKNLETNMDLILDKLKDYNKRLVCRNDSSTGGIIYDERFWELLDEVKIRRKGEDVKAQGGKFCCCYLFRAKKNPELVFWVVNIHLKAPVGYVYNDSINQLHIAELGNILYILYCNYSNYQYQIPVYMCGDYNNDSFNNITKNELVQRAYKNIVTMMT